MVPSWQEESYDAFLTSEEVEKEEYAMMGIGRNPPNFRQT